ncbi:MAG: hypothetical protein AAFO07_01540 [Bacteroidota bacterium]
MYYNNNSFVILIAVIFAGIVGWQLYENLQLKQDYRTLEIEQHQERHQHLIELEHSMNQISQYEKEIYELRTQVTNLQEQNQSLRNKNEELNSSIVELKSKISSLQTTIKEFESEVFRLTQLLSDVELANINLKDSLQAQKQTFELQLKSKLNSTREEPINIKYSKVDSLSEPIDIIAKLDTIIKEPVGFFAYCFVIPTLFCVILMKTLGKGNKRYRRRR